MARIAGAFSATWNGADIGLTERGFNIENIIHEEAVHADSAGDVPIDAVEQGVEVIVTLDSIDYTSIENAIKAVSNSLGGGFVNVGLLRSTLAKSLVLTPITALAGATAATSAASEATKVFTFPLAIVADNFNILLSSKLRKGPLRFKCYPNISTGIAYTKA